MKSCLAALEACEQDPVVGKAPGHGWFMGMVIGLWLYYIPRLLVYGISVLKKAMVVPPKTR